MPKGVRVIKELTRATVKRGWEVGRLMSKGKGAIVIVKSGFSGSAGRWRGSKRKMKGRRELGKENELIMGKDEGIVATVRGRPGIGYTRYESKSDGNSRTGERASKSTPLQGEPID